MARRLKAHDPATTAQGASGDVVTIQPDQRSWRTALAHAGGDHRRLEVLPDGSVVAHNRPVDEMPPYVRLDAPVDASQRSLRAWRDAPHHLARDDDYGPSEDL